jgi:zinc D-Ala-D-Ala carboxypeptidase
MGKRLKTLPPPPAGYHCRMPAIEEATTLELIGPDVFGRDVLLSPPAAKAWRELRKASEAGGVRLLLVSGFRSIAYQARIVGRKLEAGSSLAEVLLVSAYPGHSEHHAGTAVDVGSPDAEHLSEEFERTAEFAWLAAHAHDFGFAQSYPRENDHGIAFEPWHWNYKA